MADEDVLPVPIVTEVAATETTGAFTKAPVTVNEEPIATPVTLFTKIILDPSATLEPIVVALKLT